MSPSDRTDGPRQRPRINWDREVAGPPSGAAEGMSLR